MDPRPADDEIPALYRTYYTHAASTAAFDGFRGVRLGGQRLAANLNALERAWGYSGASAHAPPGTSGWPTKLFSRLPGAERRAGELVRYLARRPAGRLLDVGCGNGAFLLTMRALGWQVEGLEPDAEAVGAARSAGLDVMQGNAGSADLLPGAYDAITLNHVIEHLPDPKQAIATLVRALADGGTLVSISPNPAGALARWFGRDWRGLEPPRHLVLPSPHGYLDMARGVGLKAQVWTRASRAIGMFRDSSQIRRRGCVEGDGGWGIAKLYGYLLAPLLGATLKDSGDEVICVLRNS